MISCEPETVLAMPDSSVPDDEKITQMLSNLYEKQLVGIIEWAKQIPGLYCNEFLNDNISFFFLMDYFFILNETRSLCFWNFFPYMYNCNLNSKAFFYDYSSINSTFSISLSLTINQKSYFFIGEFFFSWNWKFLISNFQVLLIFPLTIKWDCFKAVGLKFSLCLSYFEHCQLQ